MALTPEQRRYIESSYQVSSTPTPESGTVANSDNVTKEIARLRNLSTPVKQKDGFFTSMAKSIVKPFAELGVSGYNEILQIGASTKAALSGETLANDEMKSRNLPWLGETKPAFTGSESTVEATKKMVGYGAEIASWYIGGGTAEKLAVNTLKGKVVKGLVSGLKTGTGVGALAGAGREAQSASSLGDIALGGVAGATGGAVLGGSVGALAPVVSKVFQPALTKFNNSFKTFIDKSIKPTIIGKKTLGAQDAFYNSAKNVVQNIAENRTKFNIVDEVGEVVDKPETVAQFAQTIDQGKKGVYKAYNEMTKSATGKDAQINIDSTVQKLNEIAGDIKHTPAVRSYAESKITEIQELQGASPEVIEARITEYNKSLQNYFRNPTSASQKEAQVDASMAAELRRVLDEKIASTEGAGYSTLKKLYGNYKAIEADVNKRAIILARQNNIPLSGLTDVFTGGELLSGIITGNPAAVAKGLFGKGIQMLYKKLNSHDRYIKKMFNDAYELFPEKVKKVFPEKDQKLLPERSSSSIELQSPGILESQNKLST